MKLVFFNDHKLGLVKDDRVVDLSSAVQDVNQPTPQDLLNGVIAGFQQTYRARFEELSRSAQGVPLSSVQLRSPVPRPNKIVAMAANYLENGALKEPRPINAFLKSPESVIGTGDTVMMPPAQAPIFHHEAELGIVIGREATNIRADQAMGHIFGYVNFVDVSARGLHANSFFWGKSWDTFGPCGPYLVTADEVADPQSLAIRLWVNGDLRQDYNTSDMGHKIPRTIEWISSVVTLEPGDLIACGTNHQGLSAIQDGDNLEMEIPGLGRLQVKVRDDLKRSWPREIDRGLADFISGRSSSPPAWIRR
ncbi:MAG: fumarylacetoacetate hydrolase family protein [Chloroflexi bacterium]|nr:fumarylacetoacetate hydrolase family protein [Chloroflexota bacterium]